LQLLTASSELTISNNFQTVQNNNWTALAALFIMVAPPATAVSTGDWPSGQF
jgi:hypothetical protein